MATIVAERCIKHKGETIEVATFTAMLVGLTAS
jgi:hypothetical protein